MSLAERLKMRLSEVDMSQRELADRIGMSHVAISKLITGRTETSRKLVDIAEVLGCSPEWLQKGIPDQIDRKNHGEVLIPLLSIRLHAGPGAYIDSGNIIDWIPISKDWLLSNGAPVNAFAAAPMSGDSMLPRLKDGDIVLINTNDTIPTNGGIYAIDVDGEVRIKRLVKRIEGSWVVSSDNKSNPAYSDEVISHHNFEKLRIIGRAVKVLMGDL